MALTEGEKDQIQRGIMRLWSENFEESSGFTKGDLRTAIDDADTWIDSNQSSYNTGLSATFRTNATQAQKTLLFCAVAAMRVSATFARKLFGEID